MVCQVCIPIAYFNLNFDYFINYYLFRKLLPMLLNQPPNLLIKHTNKIQILKNIYNFFFQHSYLQMDNDGPLLKHNYHNHRSEMLSGVSIFCRYGKILCHLYLYMVKLAFIANFLIPNLIFLCLLNHNQVVL